MDNEMFPNDRSLVPFLNAENQGIANTQQGNGMLQGMMPMLAQYLSAAGQDIGAGKPIGTNVNAATQRNLAAQSQTKLLQKILAGGGKITMDGQKFNISGHPDLLKEGGAATGGEPVGTGASTKSGSAPGETSNAPQSGTSVMSQILQGNTTLNPTSSPLGNINANDLVGLTPENISGALALKFHQDKLTQETINSQFDNLYKLALSSDVLTKRNRPFPVPVPGIGTVTEEEWRALPNDQQSYAAYVYQSKKSNSSEPVMSLAEWKGVTTDTKLEYLKALMSDPNLMQGAKELARAGATHINLNDEKIALEKAKGKLAGQLYFAHGTHLKDLAKHKESKEYRMKTFQFDKPEDRANFEAADTAAFIRSKIDSMNGEVLDIKWKDENKKVMIWTVKWQSGDTETISHAVRK